jgi:putative ABC transport system permease protein
MADLLINRHARSGPAIWYRVRADLRGRRLSAGSVMLVVALATTLIGLALAVFGSAQAPFDRLFTQLNGAHLWVYYPSAPTQAQIDAVTHAPNVAASTGLEEGTGNAAVLLASQKFDTYLQTFPIQQPAIGQLLITQGHALASNDPDGVIINQQFADAQHLRVGEKVSLVTPQGPARVHVRGLSIDVNQVSGNETTQATIYLLRTTFEHLYPQPDRWVMGLRLVDPSALGQTTQTILQRLQAQGYSDKTLWDVDWLSYREVFSSSSRLTAILLLSFGIVGLVAAGVIVANLVIGQVLAQQRDLGILKAVGFTPLQLVRTLVLEYLLLGLLGAVAGLVLVGLIAPSLLAALGASLGVPVPPHYDLGTGALMLAGVLLVVAVCAVLPAWRAGLTRIVDAIQPGGALPKGGRARLAGLMFGSGLSVVLALGMRGITARPLRALLVSLTLLLGVMTAVFGLGFGATLDKYAHDPALNGIYSDVYVSPAPYDPGATQQLLASRPEVEYYYSTYSREGQLTDGETLSVLFTGGDTRRIAAAVSTGRWFNTGANELVVSAFTLRHLGLHLGEQVPLVFHLGEPGEGRQVTIPYTIAGTMYMTQRPDEGYASLSSLTAHAMPDQLLANTGYEVTLRSGVSPQTFEQRMQALTADRIGVKVYDLTPQGGTAQGPLIMLFLSIALMVVAGVGILNAMALSTRERYRELATLKAVGLTPRQVLGSVINGALALGILAVLIGIPLGLWLNTLVAKMLSNSIGGPPNIQISINWWGLAFLIPATALVTVLGAYVPARWAAGVPAAEVLRYE